MGWSTSAKGKSKRKSQTFRRLSAPRLSNWWSITSKHKTKLQKMQRREAKPEKRSSSTTVPPVCRRIWFFGPCSRNSCLCLSKSATLRKCELTTNCWTQYFQRPKCTNRLKRSRLHNNWLRISSEWFTSEKSKRPPQETRMLLSLDSSSSLARFWSGFQRSDKLWPRRRSSFSSWLTKGYSKGRRGWWRSKPKKAIEPQRTCHRCAKIWQREIHAWSCSEFFV